MDKENGEMAERGGGGEKGGTGAPPDAASLLDAASLFGHSLFGGIPGGFGNHLAGHHLPGAAAYAMMGSRGSSSSGYGPPHHPPTTAPGSYGSLGTLSVAASQAASLGINPAILSSEARHCATGAAWWTMASHLAAQDYLARLQASAAASGMSFGGLTGAEGLVPGYSLLSAPHSQPHVSSSKSSSSKSSSSSKLTTTTAASLHSSSTPNLVSSSSTSHISHHREREREHREREREREKERERERERDRENRERDAAPSPHPLPGIISDPTSILGGVRLPPDTEIIKYTSSIVGPKIPGTTNRGRKKTISLDPPSVSVMPTHSSTGLPIERGGRRHPRSRVLQEPPEYRDSPISSSLDRVEVIKLPAYSTNGTLRLNIPNFGSSSSTPENDAPLNLSLKPQSSSASATPTLSTSTNSNTSSISLASSLSTSQPSERTSRRKPGPKPRRVIQTPSPVIPAAPSPSLAQLFAAADSPRPSSGSEESESQVKESRPRNLGRGTSKPKKNTVASLLAQSRALGIKPTPGLDVSPPNNQMSLLKSNVLGSTAQLERESPQLSPQHSPSSNKAMLTETEAESAAEGEEASALSLVSHQTNAEDSEKEKEKEREKEMDVSSEDTSRTEATKHKRHLVSSRSDGDNKLKIRAVEGLSEDSSAPDVSSESGSGSEEGFPTDSEDGEEAENTSKREGEEGTAPVTKRRKLEVDERELRIPLEHGWRRETFISGVSRIGTIKGEVVYYSPCGRRFKQYPDVVRFLEKNNIVDISRENFSFSSRVLIGEFLQPSAGDDLVRLSEDQVMKRLEELRLTRTFKSRSGSGSQRGEISRLAQEQKLQQQIEKEKAAVAAKEAKRMAKEEAARQKEQVRLMKEQERTERQEAIRREREQRNQQMMEARRRRQEELEKQRQEEQLRKQQERELKRQQAVIIKEQAVQLYMQELNKQREMLYTVELERERRRQHMVLVKALEARKRLEERERKRQEVRAEKVASRERRMEQRRLELELVRELRKPMEDMELADQKPLPTLNRIPGLKLSGQAFADTLMVFEFLHNFGETLGFDMDSLPTLNSLQMALLNDEEAEEELLSVMTHLLVCAIEDPGIPNPARHTTILGQSLKQADITHGNLSEILRIYLYANATGEVKALTGLYFERDREKKSDHHNVYGEVQPPCGKNAAFFEHLHENPTWRMSEWLHELPFLALNPTHKAAILAFLCNELLQNKAVIRQIENSIETVAQLRKERWILDTKIRKMRMLHGRKIRQTIMMAPNKLESNGCEESNDTAGVEGKGKDGDDDDDNDEDAEDAESGNESEGTQPEEEEDKNLTAEELNRKMERLVRQCDNTVQAINTSAQQLRALCFGQDRYWRRYWSLPCAGGVFVEAMESAEPELYNEREESGDQAEVQKHKTSRQGMEMETSSAQGKLDEEMQKQMCNERLKCSSSSAGGNDDDKSSAEAPYPNAIRKSLQKPLEFEEMEETKNEHRKKRTREKDECLDKGVETDGVSSWIKKERANARSDQLEKMEVDEEILNSVHLVKGEFGEEIKAVSESNLVKNFRHIDDDETNKTEDRSEILVKQEMHLTKSSEKDFAMDISKQIPNRITNINEVSAIKSEETVVADGSASKIKVEGNVICVPSGLTITKADVSENTSVKSEVKEDSLSAVKVEIKSDLFSTELNAIKKEDKGTGTVCVDPGLVFSSKSEDTFLVHRPIQFERLGECMEKANAETGPVIVPNGDKFNALNHLYNLNSNTIFNNGKELNGSFLLGSTAGTMSSEHTWFSILPRDACDSTSVTNGTCMASRLMEGSTELRIPVFPPPSRLSSPSPGGSQCESPAPLILTPEEMVQLELMKKSGPIEPQEAKPVPYELRRGWWRITDEDQLKTIFEKLHSRGVRERELKRVLSKYMEHTKECNRKICVASGDKAATDLDITDMDHKVAALPGGAPLRDGPDGWFPEVALRVDMAILEQMEALEDKVANASMQVKGWKVPIRASTEEGASFRPSCLPAIGENANKKNPIEIAKDRLMSLEAAIERRYLKPPLGISTGDVNLSGMSGECATTEDNVPKGLVVWREAVGRAHTSAQLAMALYMLEASIAWDKSIMKANCQFCHSGDNEDKLLLCDGCDKGYHTYCFRPKMENIPDGDWYCFECMNKATGERNCIVCGKKAGKNLVTCDACPRAYHTDCLQPPLPKVPRGKWFCPTCQAKQPKKRNSGRRSTSHSKSRDKERESESSSSEQLPPATPPATPAAVTCSDENSCTSLAASSASPTTTPSTPNKKDRGKKINKDLNPCKTLLEDLEMHDEAWPFLLPVNTKQFPTYRKIIKSPMDLSTIKKKLQESQYKSREDFCADVRLIFNNCETFNEDDSPVGKAGHSMRSFFETRWGEMNMNHPKASGTSATSPTTPNTSNSTSAALLPT